MAVLAANAPTPEVTLNGGVATAHLVIDGLVDDASRIAYNAQATAARLDVRAIERDGLTMLLVELPSVVTTTAGVFAALSAATRLLDEQSVVPADPTETEPGQDELDVFESLVAAWFDAYRAANAGRAPT
jgi:hypothetical protein